MSGLFPCDSKRFWQAAWLSKQALKDRKQPSYGSNIAETLRSWNGKAMAGSKLFSSAETAQCSCNAMPANNVHRSW
jgi:hypothetical protein